MKKLFLLLVILFFSSLQAQTADYLFFRNLVFHADNSLCIHTPPEVSFIMFLNRNMDKILIENAPRWDVQGDENIPGNGSFAAELGNFTPVPALGDIVSARFFCSTSGQQAELFDSIYAIPWERFPISLRLQQVSAPAKPVDVILTKLNATQRSLSWTSTTGVTYTIYRHSFQDTLSDGRSRNLYTRVAQGVTGGSFTDSNLQPNTAYGYIIFAVNASGVWSMHSEEVFDGTGSISSLSLLPNPRSVKLTWASCKDSELPVLGYSIYRKTSGAAVYSLVGFTADTFYTDSRLNLGTTYIYKVRARTVAAVETATSPAVETATLNSAASFVTYANLKVAVPIYQHTNSGSISDADVEKIKRSLELGKIFYWRNSKLKLNIEYTYYPIKTYEIFSDPEDSWGSMMKTAEDLAELGVMNTQYDLIFRVVTAVNGYWSYGVQQLPLPGPERKTGFSTVQWPIGTGVSYPGNNSAIHYGLIWVFVHELQHAIDDLYYNNGLPDMYHGDIPWMFPVACGEHFDFQAKILRNFNAYQELESNWGWIYESADADMDGFPDSDPMVVLDEARFGSSNQSSDSDGDNLTDREEAFNGTYSSSDPTDMDSDNDGMIDGQDNFPRYKVNRVIPLFSPVIDGTIEAAWPVVDDSVAYSDIPIKPTLYMGYSPDSLYVALRIPGTAIPEFWFDFQGDGFWWGSGNLQAEVNIGGNNFTVFHTRDASQRVRDYCLTHDCPGGMWDDESAYIAAFGGRVFTPSSVKLRVNRNANEIQIEMAILKNDYAGLTLQSGSPVGLNIRYSAINNQAKYGSMFDLYSFENFYIGQVSDVDEKNGSLLEYKLNQNYPNPFNPETLIGFSLPEDAHVQLTVYNLLGEEAAKMLDADMQRGTYNIPFSGNGLASGVYFYVLQTNTGIRFVKKMVLLR